MARVRLEMYGQAEPLLSAALMRCRSEQPQRKELRYWLARAHEGTGRTAAALPLYRAVHRVDPAFMDTAARLAAIAEYDGFDGSPEEMGDLARVSLANAGADAAGADLLDGGADGQDGPWPAGGRVPGRLGGGGRAGRPGGPPVPPASLPGAVRDKDGGAGPGRAVPPPFPASATDPAAARAGPVRTGAHGGPRTGQAPGEGVVGAVEMARLRADQGLPVQPPKRHFVFSGPSGTGKTTVARILGRVFYALGLLGGDHLIEAQRADLVGEFSGRPRSRRTS